jgi:hypothetical protein
LWAEVSEAAVTSAVGAAFSAEAIPGRVIPLSEAGAEFFSRLTEES